MNKDIIFYEPGKNNFIELCSGAGGLSSGLIKAGFVPELLVDNDKDCVNTIKLNHPEYRDIIIYSSS